MTKTLSMLMLLISIGSAAQAQSTEQAAPISYKVEAIKLFLNDDGDDGFSLLTSTWFATAEFQLRQNLGLVADLPVSHAAFGDADASTVIGNPYVGIVEREGNHRLELGARLPLIKAIAGDGESGFVGMFTDVSRLEAFAYEAVPVRASLTLARPVGRVLLEGTAGATMLFNTDKDEHEEGSETFLTYAGGVGIPLRGFAARAGFSGRLLASENGEMRDRMLNQFEVSADRNGGRVRPGVELRLPTGEYREIANATLMFRIRVDAGR